jgi:hypothetical protein
MGNYPWEPEYCVYDVCTCSHAFMEHEKGPTKCYNSSYFDSAKQEVIKVDKCPCKKFRFYRSESFSLYTKKGDNQ